MITATLIALIFLIISFIWAAVVEKGVNSSLLALWAIASVLVLDQFI